MKTTHAASQNPCHNHGEISPQWLASMLALGFHFGHLRARRDGRFHRFVLQSSCGLDIIDPEAFHKGILLAKAAAKNISGAVLFVADKTSFARMPRGAALPENSIAGRWKPGAITNLNHGPLAEKPSALFLASLSRSKIAAAEARKAGIPVFALCDSDTNPNLADYPIPSNDDRPLIALEAFSEIFGKAGEEAPYPIIFDPTSRQAPANPPIA